MPGGTTTLHLDGGGIARIRIENPPLNILTIDVREALLRHINSLEDRADTKVVIVESAGERAFSAGADIREFPEAEVDGVAKIRFEQYVLNRLAGLPQVTIARLSGHVLGGGAELMLACDLRVADETAMIGFPEVHVGALPAAGGMKRLTREIGPVRAREMVMTGKPIPATKALDLGLVNRVVPPGSLSETVSALAKELAQAPADALRLAKRCIAAATMENGIDTIEAEAFGELYRGKNLLEGVAAFRSKRRPRFDVT